MASTTNTQARKGEWTAKGQLPDGAYHLRAERGRFREGKTGAGYEVLFKWVGTNMVLHYFLSSNEAARWAWRDIADEFDDLPLILGREFIVIIKKEDYAGKKRNMIKQIICEVLHG